MEIWYMSFIRFICLNSSQGTNNQASDDSCQQAIFHDADPMLQLRIDTLKHVSTETFEIWLQLVDKKAIQTQSIH